MILRREGCLQRVPLTPQTLMRSACVISSIVSLLPAVLTLHAGWRH